MKQVPGYTRVIAKIRNEKPHLLGNFVNAGEYLETLLPLNREILVCLLKLTYAAEFVYIDPRQLFPLLVSRNEFEVFAGLFYDLARAGYQYAGVLLEAYPGLAFPIKLIKQELLFLARSAARLPAGGVRALAICLKYREEDQCRFMLQQMAIVGHYSPGTMVDCALLIYNRLRALPPDLLQRWLTRGTDLLTSNRVDEGVKFLLLQSKASRQLLGLNHVVLEDYKRVLKIYCASLAGRDLNIAGLDLSLFGLKTPYTDGATIFLPPEVRFFNVPLLNERAYTVLAALQAACISMGTFSLDLEQWEFRTELRDRYGTQLPEIAENVRRQYNGIARSVRERADGELEVVFSHDRSLLVLNTEHEKLFYGFPTPDFARELFTLVENGRIEKALAASYPGLKEDFRLVNTYLWNHRPRPVISPAVRDRTLRFLAAVETLVQFSLLGRWKTEISDPKFLEIIQALIRILNKITGRGMTVYNSAGIMFELYNIFYDNFPIVTFCTQNDISESFDGINKPELYPEVVLDVSPDLLKETKPDFVSSEDQDDKEKEIDLTSSHQADRKLEELRRAITSGDVRVFRYPEYDYLKNSYTKDHCTLFEQVLPSRENDFYDQVLQQHKLAFKKIKKRFLYMRPEGMELSRRWYSGSHIHITDAVDYSIALLRGESPDEKIYCRKILNRRDIVVAILMDASSSTDAMVGRERIIDIEKAALAILASALAVIDDPFGIFSFFSLGPRNVYVNVVKDFQEPWHKTARHRIAALQAYASNRDGCAIRHITGRLLQQPERTRLLLLLSDGIPADLDYGSKSSSETSQYAIEDTRRAILECRRQDIIPYCITIDRFARQYVPHLYGNFHYAVLDDVTKLPEKLSQLYLRLTR